MKIHNRMKYKSFSWFVTILFIFNSIIVINLIFNNSSAAETLSIYPIEEINMFFDQPGEWWDDGWQYRKKITIDHTEVDANLNDFPLNINLISDSDLATKAQSDGGDIVFVDDNSNKLNHEIESYDSDDGGLVAWINIPTLSSTTDTTIYMYYGNPDCDNQENVFGVWVSDFEAVWHLSETTGGSGAWKDSTGNGYDGTDVNMNPSDQGTEFDAAGKMNGGIQMDGVDDRITTSLFPSNSPRTIEYWVKYDTLTGDSTIGCHDRANHRFYAGLRGTNAFFGMGNSASASYSLSVSTDNWYHLVVTGDGSNARYYLNGNEMTSFSYSQSGTSSLSFIIGCTNGNNYGYLDGVLDEIRVSYTSRSSDWISTSFNNQNNPESFYEVGEEVTNSNSPPIVFNEIPEDGSEGVGLNPILQADIFDGHGDMVYWEVRSSASGTWTTLDDGFLPSGEGTVSTPSVDMDEYFITYWWSVNATDSFGSGDWTNKSFSFTTGEGILLIQNPYPNGIETNYNPRLSIETYDSHNDTLTVIFKTNSTGSWETLGTYFGQNGKYTQDTSGMDIKNHKYYWCVNITDGNIWVNETYSFTVQPFVLKWAYTTGADTTIGPLAVDIDKDGIYEIFTTGENQVTCVNGSNGELIWEYFNNEIELHSPFEIYDLNNDGIEEIIISGRQWIFGRTIALHANNGTEFWNVRAESGGKYLTVADIEGNGYPYVYICSGDPISDPPESGRGRLRKLRGIDGEILEEVFAWRPCWGGPSIADADNDGDFEVYLTDRSSGYHWPDNKLAKGMQCYDAQTLELIWYDEDVLCSSHGIAVVDVNNDDVLDAVAYQQSGNGIYTIDGKTGFRMPGKWGEGLGLRGHSQFSIYDIDGDENLELITARGSEAKIWDMGTWSLEATLDTFHEPPKMGNVIGDEKLEIIGAFSDISIYNGSTYELIERIERGANGNTLVQDIDNDGQNELIVIEGVDGRLRVYDTSGYASNPKVRTNSHFYSERNMAAGVYVPLPGAPQPILKDEYPANESEYVELNPTLSIHAIDFRYDLMNITISTNASGTWTPVAWFNDTGNDIYTYSTSNMDEINTTYYWKITEEDPYVDNLITSETYHFTTVADAPFVTNPIPNDSTIRVPIDTDQIRFDLVDYPAGNMDYTVETSPDVGSGSGTGVGDGTYFINVDLSYFTEYTWYVNVTDGVHETKEVFTFMTEPESIVADQEFDDSDDSQDLRDNGLGQDWYVSYGEQNLVTLDSTNVGGNTGKKVKFTGDTSDSVYLSQEFIQEQDEDFSVSFDVYVDEIINISGSPDRAGWLFLGDDSEFGSGPCDSDSERFVYLSFVKNGGGGDGTMDLMACERYGGWNDFSIIAEDLLLDNWYNIEVRINFKLNRYSVYIDGELGRTIKPRTFKDKLTHIAFAQLENGAGTYYIDNVFSPVLD